MYVRLESIPVGPQTSTRSGLAFLGGWVARSAWEGTRPSPTLWNDSGYLSSVGNIGWLDVDAVIEVEEDIAKYCGQWDDNDQAHEPPERTTDRQ
jgi:hypothetical protein